MSSSIAAFDIGGTALKMGVVLTDGEIVETKEVTIQHFDGLHILSEMKEWVIAHPEVSGIAISAPGYVNPKTGVISMGGAIRDFDEFNMLEWSEKNLKLPTAIENDANCALLAEKWLGKAKPLENFLCLTIGTGIGGGIYVNDKLVRGNRYRAGEFGYMFTETPGTALPGTQTLNDTTTIYRMRMQYAAYTERALEDITGEEIFARYDAGDVVCTRLVSSFYNGICTGLYNLIYLFDPSHIFIGGGITSRPTFIEELKEQMTWFGLRDTVIEAVTHRNQAGLLGAVYHYLQGE